MPGAGFIFNLHPRQIGRLGEAPLEAPGAVGIVRDGEAGHIGRRRGFPDHRMGDRRAPVRGRANAGERPQAQLIGLPILHRPDKQLPRIHRHQRQPDPGGLAQQPKLAFKEARLRAHRRLQSQPHNDAALQRPIRPAHQGEFI